MPAPPPPAVSQSQTHHPKAPRKQHVSCAWSQVHGIAELVAVRDHHATYRFYPGNTLFRKSHPPHNASPGNEYKAIVRRPMNGPCDAPELVVVDPLE
ncbi:hypothetical protein [Mangrovitalea sediminis]|uniref:hypothetical protein n=1 Tax=Mangrovitalea sediminis TaxID=1982043 RepID=UPI0011774E6F|nr:hypothetical protein [Mangrovitalea sediminis]